MDEGPGVRALRDRVQLSARYSSARSSLALPAEWPDWLYTGCDVAIATAAVWVKWEEHRCAGRT